MIRRNLIATIALFALSAGVALQAQPSVCDSLSEPPRRPLTLLNDAASGMHLLKDLPPSAVDLANGNRRLLLELDAAGFFFDAEYDSPCASGYSVTGFRLSPTLVYGINHKAQLRVGFNAMAFAGLDSLYMKRPSLSLLYSPTPWLQLVAGTLFGGYFHETGMPVYDPSRWIYHYQEDGLQILTQTDFWKSDTWLDWHHYLTPGTPDQEQFTMGSRHELRLLKIETAHGAAVQPCWAYPLGTPPPDTGTCQPHSGFEVLLPMHFTANHRGGQVNTVNAGSPTVFNESAALHMRYRRTGSNRHNTHEINASVPVYFYQCNMTPPDRNGYGLLPSLGYSFSHVNTRQGSAWLLHATAGRWHGEHYFNTLGSPLFFSPAAAAVHTTGIANPTDETHDAWYFRAAIEHEFKGLDLGLQVDCTSDSQSSNSFIFSFYMRFKERFLLF